MHAQKTFYTSKNSRTQEIDSTSKYVKLEQALFDKDADSFTCKVAKTSEEIKQLIKAGFDYVTGKDGLIYFTNANSKNI